MFYSRGIMAGWRVVGIFLVAMLLSGCSLKAPDLSSGGGSIWKSGDSGATFEPKITVDEKRKITSADVVSWAFHPTDHNVIYVGTLESGLFKTIDGAETWTPLEFPPVKIYGLSVDRQNGERLFASGSYENVGKIYRSEDGGQNWKEVYTEPGPGTVITALASHPALPDVVYAGTSAGVVIRSSSGGETWKNLTAAKAAVTDILLRPTQPDAVTLLVLGNGVMMSSDAGQTWKTYSTMAFVAPDPASSGSRPDSIATLVADPSRPETLYAGAKNGLFRSSDGGGTWQNIAIIESSKKYPIRSVGVNPRNGSEIVYVSGATFYKSTDGGTRWSTTELPIDRGVSVIEYDPSDPSVIYLGVRKF